jgi:hypothetical protein
MSGPVTLPSHLEGQDKTPLEARNSIRDPWSCCGVGPPLRCCQAFSVKFD